LLKGDAGHVVSAFGDFVVGGNVVVGLIVFLILVVIQFVVVTNGAGRVAEVGARFTLDAMPGKQMAIDADLNAGQITEEQARERRSEIAREADFYGAMDGASKFVKGDAMAAVMITMVNLIGGFLIGVVQRGMPINEAITTYSLLTVGDGLVTMIPALLVLAIGLNPSRSLVISQVVLSFGIPFALVPLVLLTRRRDIMGALVNRPLTTLVASIVAALIIALNGFLLIDTFFG
ncbi:MAG: flagellar biosynthesis protein FlhA, partial [Baekduia sp.]|nr:flagellar biosynthesis protein FlhA [Baekduia sp.]